MPKAKHILVIRLSAMGDVAMTVPVLRALVLQYPDVRLTVLSRPFFKPFFDGMANVDFFPVDLKSRHKGFRGLLRLYSDLRQLNIDTVADLHNVLRSKIIRNLFSLSGKRTAATDKGRNDRKALTRSEKKIFVPVKPMMERHCATFAALGFPIDLTHPVFPKKASLSQKIMEVTGPKSGKWIGIAPFAQYESKVYPLDLLQQVIDILAAESDIRILLFGGGQKEITALEAVAKSHENVLVLAGKMELERELVVISNLDLMLSMDSGNAHLAAMLGVKVITLWGATHPYAGFAPFNQPESNCITADRQKYPMLPTSVYGNKKVAGYEDAMRTITPQSITAKIKEEL